MSRESVRLGTFVLWTIGIAGCGVDPSAEQTSERAPSSRGQSGLSPAELDVAMARLQRLDRNVGLGTSGGDVRAVHAYLTRYGYFPNEQLARENSGWRPLVPDAPASADVYDHRTALAVRQLQRHSSLPETGIVDDATRALMRLPRCGNPDGADDLDPSSEFSYRQNSPLSHSPSWFTGDFSTVEARIIEALDTWSAESTLSFVKSSVFPDIDIGWADLEEGTLGRASAPNWLTGTTRIQISTKYPLYYGLDPAAIPTSAYDFRSLILHEAGHALNLGHSGFPGSIMYSGLPDSTTRRELQLDDQVGISSIYDTWQHLGSDGLDIGIGKNGDVWVTAASNNTIWKYNPGGFWDLDQTGHLGKDIAVAFDGRPYVVAPNGSIWSRSTNDPFTGAWEEMVGGGCARDIGVGAEPGDTDLVSSVWVISCGDDADTTIWKHTGSGWTQDLSGGLARRIAVDYQGVPWINTAKGGIYRYTTNDPFTGTWAPLPGAAMDIGIGAGNYAWAIGTSPDPGGGGWSIHSWNEQPAGPGNKPAPALAQWRSLPGGARVVAVGPKGDPWIVNTRGQIFKTLK